MTSISRTLAPLAPERARVALSVLLLSLTIGASVALMGTSAWLISTAALHPSIAALQVAVVGVRFFGISRGVFRYLERLVSHDVTFRILSRLRVATYRALVPLVPGRLVLAHSGDLLTRLVADVDTLEHALVRVVGPACAALVVCAAVAFMLAVFDASIAFTVVALLVAAGALVPWIAWRAGREAGRTLVTRRGDLAGALVDGVHGAADLVAFGRAASHARSVGVLGAGLRDAQVRSAQASALGSALVALCADGAAVAALALAVPLVRAGEMNGVNVAVVVLLSLAAFEAVAALPGAAQGLAATRAAAVRVFGLQDEGRVVSADFVGSGFSRRADAVDALAPLSDSRDSQLATRDHRRLSLAVRDLTFTYPGAREPVLRGLTFDLHPAGVVALFGPSGSGKSTIAHLIVRFWDPPPGTILAGDEDVAAMDPDVWRTRVALMSQNAHLFAGTLRENVLLAAPDASPESLMACITAAGLDEVVARLPQGLDTWVGEQGALLSGGERQRVALARAMLKAVPLLVLDEPTASVDAPTERRIAEAIDLLSRDRAVLLITHRTAGLERAREILVLHEGLVVERGSYAELMQRGTWFPRMVALERDEAAVETV